MLQLVRALLPALCELSVLLVAAPNARAQDSQEQAGLDSWYRVTEVNPGLGTPPGNIDRTTPRSSLESFLFRADAEEWGEAAHMLDLSAIPSDEQAKVGPERAEQFATLLDRRIIIDYAVGRILFHDHRHARQQALEASVRLVFPRTVAALGDRR